MQHTASYKHNYPRPQLVREGWTNLDGKWDFAFDFNKTGESKGYTNGFKAQKQITVPYAYQVPASGIGDTALCEQVWYQNEIELSPEKGKRIMLRLEGCDYRTRVWINGKFCGEDTGGYHRLSFDLTDGAKKGKNTLVICVNDDYSTAKPRGKQRWKDKDFGCWYIDTTGIYKTAWLETVSELHIEKIAYDTDIRSKTVTVKTVVNGAETAVSPKLKLTVKYGGKTVGTAETAVGGENVSATVSLGGDVMLWNVGDAKLYDTELELYDGDTLADSVKSYFGMREITIDGGRILLNGKPLYQKLVLDQGYWTEGGLTPPNVEAFEDDIKLMLSMGFNGCRKHEKIEDERFLYYADIYGYITWCEMPSMYEALNDESKAVFKREWLIAVNELGSHPCILCWVPFNESWGIEHICTDKSVQDFVNDTYYATKAADSTRPVITNDGWEHTVSDILTIHHYTQSGDIMHACFDEVQKCCAKKYAEHDRGAFSDGYEYKGQPIMITEFGGTAFVKDAVDAKWGYGDGVKNTDEFISRFGSLIDAIDRIPFMNGYCYTQLSDVYHEVNGLTDFARNPKASADVIRSILTKRGR